MKTRFIFETVEITDVDTDESRIAEVITDTDENYSYENLEDVVDLLNKLVNDNEELGISIKFFEDDIATKDKKIEEQQAIMIKLRNENIILKNKIEDLRVSLFMQDKVLQRQMQKSDLDE